MNTGAKSFSIKGGTCHIFEDRIEIQAKEISLLIATELSKRGLMSAVWVYLGISFMLAVSITLLYSLNNLFLTGFLAGALMASLFFAISRRSQSFAPVIMREDIQDFIYQKAVPMRARAYFEITFKPNGKSRTYKRRLNLPNRIHNGASLADTAFWMVKEEGLIS